jgi:guanosine-3',5'-bis(diphosphate) 3'-pyrophosphohydrolase
MWNPDRYQQALTFAALRHGDQREPGHGLPYVVHVCKVAMEVQRAAFADPGFDVDLAVTAALLHDTLEDTATSRDELAQHFGEAVADAVDALTKKGGEDVPKEQRMLDSLARIRAQPRAVWVVKLADRITNLEEPPASWSIEKRRRYQDEARTIFASLRGGCDSLEQRLAQKIDDYARWCR